MLPENFSESEHLQDLFRRYANRQVRDFFIDLGGEDWDPDISTTRGSLRHGCTHKDEDSLPMTLLRWELFSYVRKLKFDVPYYGVPITTFDQVFRYRPQITLYFLEDLGDVEPGYRPVTGEISFRLMDEQSDTITPTRAQTLATRIKSNFGVGGGLVWRKGRLMCTYTDQMRGYHLKLFCRNDSDARAIITQVLDIQNHVPNWAYLNINENQEESTRFPVIPPNERIYGEIRRTPRKRPIADVRFQVSWLKVHGLQNPITLYDRTGVYPGALVT